MSGNDTPNNNYCYYDDVIIARVAFGTKVGKGRVKRQGCG